MTTVSQQQFYKGSLPPPDMLEHFERVQPGLADRIAKMAEAGVNIQLIALKLAGRDRLLGQIFSSVLTLSTLGCGTFLLYADKPVGGLISLLAGIGVIVNAIIRQNRKKSAN